MATIYRKINLAANQPSGYDNTLILGPQESILYPFDLGDYTNVRVGLLWTPTASATDDNVAMSTVFSESTYTVGDRRQSFYAGLNNSSLLLPYSDGCNYIGIGIWSGGAPAASNRLIGSAGSSHRRFAMVCGRPPNTNEGWVSALTTYNFHSSTGGRGLLTNGNSFGYSFQFWSNNDGGLDTTLYGFTGINSGSSIMRYGFLSMDYIFQTNSDGKMIYAFRVITNKNAPAEYGNVPRAVSDSSNRTLKFLNSYPVNLEVGPYATGYWTDTFTSGGNNLSKPTAFFLYNPFFLARLRIHNIIAEKYA